jgi:NAD(P)-dependent dehydrogenase (short-subunit alcohol dehydrogenase family)
MLNELDRARVWAMTLFRLDGQTALITGGSRGIGRAIALRMAEAGAQVIVNGRNRETCEATVEEIQSAGGQARALPYNISKVEDATALAHESLNAFGKVDIFVGNAAANPHFGPVLEVEMAMFDKIVDTNIKANLLISKVLAKPMAERDGGSLIFITSIAGIQASDGLGIYGMSKAAEAALTRNLAAEHGPDNIRVNCIAPGLVKTDFAKALWEDKDKLEKTTSAYPLRRMGTPDEVAGTAVWLASPAGGFVTGQTIVVDGGVSVVGKRA